MGYRLKNKNLHGLFDRMSDGEFSKLLAKEINPSDIYVDFVSYGFGAIRIRLYPEAVEKIPEYDPHAWNYWPDVKPPEGELMRVEFLWNDGSIGYRCGIFREGIWVDSEDHNLEIENVYRFRPWDDPNEDEG